MGFKIIFTNGLIYLLRRIYKSIIKYVFLLKKVQLVKNGEFCMAASAVINKESLTNLRVR